jgi:glycosyltransferase involved in cell wall biosynthesis
MDVAILDNGLRGFGEHSFSLLQIVSAAFEARDIRTQIFCYRRADPAVMRELKAAPHFRDYLYSGRLPGVAETLTKIPATLAGLLRGRPAFSEARTAALGNRRFHDDLAALPASIWRTGNLVVIPAISQNQIGGLVDFLNAQSEDCGSRVVCQLMMNVDWTPWAKRGALASTLYGAAFGRTHARARDRLRFTAENEPMAASYREAFGVEVSILPVPLALDRPQRVSAARPRIGFFGYSKSEKGFALLPEAIERCRAAGVDADFVIQVQHDGWEAETISADRRLRSIPGLDLIVGELERDAYIALSNDIDATLLPYDPVRFGQRGSGIMTEAIAAGRPIVASEGIFAATLIRRGEAVGEIFEPYTAGALAEAIGRLVAGLDDARTAALAVAAAYRATHDGGAYVNAVLALANDPHSGQRSAIAATADAEIKDHGSKNVPG